MSEQRQDTGPGPRHRAPGAGPDDHRFPSVGRRVDAAPLADPAWLGRLRADARAAGRPVARDRGRDGGGDRGGPGVTRAPSEAPVGRPDRPDVPAALSRWRAAAGPLVALGVVVAATVAVLGAVDRGARPVSAGPAMTTGSSSPAVPASPVGSGAPVIPARSDPTSGTGEAHPPVAVTGVPRSTSTAPPLPTPAVTTPAVTTPAVTTPAVTAPAPTAAAVAAPTAAPVASSTVTVPRVLVTGGPVRVLEALQELRGTAFATGRLDLLGAVYPPGSALAAADRAAFTDLTPNGGTVAGLGFDLRDTAVSERTPVRAVITARVRQRPVQVLGATSVRRLPGRELGLIRVVLIRAAVTDPWAITASTVVGPA